MKKSSSVKLSNAQDSVIKKDRRTKAELLDILAHKEKQLMQPLLTNISADNHSYYAGYCAGVKDERENNKHFRWWKWWRW